MIVKRLRIENAELRAALLRAEERAARLAGILAVAVEVSDRMKLELIKAGALHKPDTEKR